MGAGGKDGGPCLEADRLTIDHAGAGDTSGEELKGEVGLAEGAAASDVGRKR